MYPKQFNKLISTLEKLPGVGEKTAQRYAFSLLEKEPEDIADFILSLQELKQIRRCRTCGFLSEEDECRFCVDPSRDRHKIMVLAYPQDVVAMEKTGSYNGLYHVLNGLISSTKGIFPEDINIEELLKRITPETDEIIIAVSPTMDGEMTSLYLNKILSDKGVLITRLAHGLPMGSSLDYADELTLIKALNNRRKIENE
ncbi:MAG: recombination protein RecR [Erysipelotrichaceae bacterium]|nr:recombination protein RecR [Erysipelotrichaceae bacterium]